MKKSWWGYSPLEVDEFLADLQQKKALLREQNNRASMEMSELKKLLAQQNTAELKMLEAVTLNVTSNDGVVFEARKKSRQMKEEARYNLERQKNKLAVRQKFLQEVLANLAQIEGNLTHANQYLKPLTIVTKGVEKGEKTV